ncbi:MAG: hypothetical protein J1F20_00165 [Muribaculaceae bacterium]|nr:hypothetical protein [Muribaculaceae bacterium]
MKNLFWLFWLIAVVSFFQSTSAQTRMPEIKIQQREVVDSTGFEERPYFLLIEQSEKALEEGDYESAALRLVEAMGIEPDNQLNVALLSNLGMIYFYNEQDSLALVVLDKAIERSPRLIAPHEGKARILISMGRDNEAYQEYENIIDIDSINTNARYVHGTMALYKNDLETAMKDIAVLERIVPVSPRTMLAKAILYSMTGNEIEAISIFRKLIDNDPAPEFFGRLAACQIAIDNLGDASETIGKGLHYYPDDAELYYYRALLNNKRYLPDEAHRDAKKAIELGADKAKVLQIFK